MPQDNQIEEWFETLYNNDVKLAYQREASQIRGTVRTKNNVKGKTTNFRIAGKGEVGDKVRGGEIPMFNASRGNVPCTLVDKYGGDSVDDLDELKHDANERMIMVKSASGAHGRYTDSALITAMDTTTNFVGDYTTGLTKALVQSVLESMKNKDVPNDGERYAQVTAHQWEELMGIKEFSSADYVGSDLPWLSGTEAKRWRGVMWMAHSGLPIVGTNATGFIYHKTAVGHAIATELKSTWSWENKMSAHFLNTRMSQGACLVDADGCFELRTDNTAALPA